MLTFLRVVLAQSVESTAKPAVVVASGAFFALSVADLKAIAHSEKLGLKVVMETPKKDKSAVTVLEGQGLIVELIQNDDAMPLSKAAPAAKDPLYDHGVFKAGVMVDDF